MRHFLFFLRLIYIILDLSHNKTLYNVTFDMLALVDLFVTTFINAYLYVVSEIKGIVQGCW
jgi:hypothetical protein